MNPRYPSGYTRLPIVHLRPLGHLSNKKRSVFSTEQGGFGVPVVNVLFTTSTPAFALPARPCAALLIKAYAFAFTQERSVSNPQFVSSRGVLRSYPEGIAQNSQAKNAKRFCTEQGGFEPPEPLRVQWFSKPSPSTARTPLL